MLRFLRSYTKKSIGEINNQVNASEGKNNQKSKTSGTTSNDNFNSNTNDHETNKEMVNRSRGIFDIRV